MNESIQENTMPSLSKSQLPKLKNRTNQATSKLNLRFQIYFLAVLLVCSSFIQLSNCTNPNDDFEQQLVFKANSHAADISNEYQEDETSGHSDVSDYDQGTFKNSTQHST
jgi:hypothetical protein